MDRQRVEREKISPKSDPKDGKRDRYQKNSLLGVQ